ncbi:hypothetical protein [Gleimia europaea]|uniref:hypothetical protein n=1 Tax=Gleimia europaea TaxID=66228 RepID=UPI000C7FE4AD|nr:hypothetical protein [Gleimia europaea]MDK8350402.1 hypothetical protein [Gleimia europaea]MDK8534651.1 hypothetical protein [Gleimia europaea]WIK62594.1 hypothetical protein CJ185_008775 [Gleimia europaea]
MSVQTVAVPVGARYWISSNDRPVWQEKARRTAALVRIGATAAMAHRLKVETPARLIVTVHMPSGRRSDPPNAWPTVKPIIDGFVRAGAFEDDSSEEIPEMVFRKGEKTGVKSNYRLVFEFQSIGEVQ